MECQKKSRPATSVYFSDSSPDPYPAVLSEIAGRSGCSLPQIWCFIGLIHTQFDTHHMLGSSKFVGSVHAQENVNPGLMKPQLCDNCNDYYIIGVHLMISHSTCCIIYEQFVQSSDGCNDTYSQHWGFQKIQPADIFINSDFLQQLHQQGAISGDRSGSVPLTDDVHGDRTSCGCSQWGSGSHPGDRKKLDRISHLWWDWKWGTFSIWKWDISIWKWDIFLWKCRKCRCS